ncbi:Cytochrome P450 monooxygenase BOA3 [Colletotrichum aenigma]|uniref:Cytochrome P450 monooxygenase BOA3 n=1 Tax=Colletotrichum aenigma TaxID=1215731 RepID=UPI0018729904|nr:Cytochrome P450 monooxygenase BOA3 [Colletotrichum aenigma]KAF5522546.1 Cytochrome P450 monooxygenase BOA3 [Colletotrichum aenigma]
MLTRTGDVVRIAPNDLVFRTPQAYKDIYGSTVRRREIFVKTDVQDLPEFTGFPDLGVAAERNPETHAQVARALQPSFSSRVLQGCHGVIHQVVDEFVTQLERRGEVNLTEWVDYFAHDISGELVYNREAKIMKSGDPTPDVIASRKMSYLGAVIVALKRFPLLKFPLFVCLIPWALASGISTFGKTVQGYARARIAKGGKVRHLDLLEPIIPPEGSIVSQESKKRSDDWIVAQANSLMAGALGLVTNAIISSILLLCDSPETMNKSTHFPPTYNPAGTHFPESALPQLINLVKAGATALPTLGELPSPAELDTLAAQLVSLFYTAIQVLRSAIRQS